MVMVAENTMTALGDTETDQIFGGGGRPEPGIYHCQVIEATEYDEYAEIKFEVVGPGTEIGKRCSVRLYYTSPKGGDAAIACQKRLVGFALRMRLLSQADYDAAKAAGQGMNIDFSQAIGCQALVEFKLGKPYKDKNGQERQSTEIPFGGIFDLEDEKHADIPLDAEIAAIVGVKRSSDNPFGNPAPAQQSQQAKSAQAPAQAPATAQHKTQPVAKTAAPAARPQTAQPAAAAATNKWEDI